MFSPAKPPAECTTLPTPPNMATTMENPSPTTGYYLRVGSIALFHPDPKQKIMTYTNRHCEKSPRDISYLKHPRTVVILAAIGVKKETYLVGLVTSFASAPLAYGVKFLKDSGALSIPIMHHTPQVDIDMLSLTHGHLNKQSYVILDCFYHVPKFALGTYVSLAGYPRGLRLQETSYCDLMHAIKLPPQEYQPRHQVLFLNLNLNFPEPQESTGMDALLHPSQLHPSNDVHRSPHRDLNSYSGVRSTAMAKTGSRAVSTPNGYRDSDITFFPPLPPTPCRKPSRSSRKMSSTGSDSSFDTTTPLLPIPATFYSNRQTWWFKNERWLSTLAIVIGVLGLALSIGGAVRICLLALGI
ncbi:hypothetical protein EG329_008734 [Mollisiaceae sp. DMI_Dod_QoI]|nr:hypothetical protein EG329_008734 [Helotiales sp. DMI_Dod_QoI]